MSRCLRQVRDKSVCVTLLEFSPVQYTGKVSDKVRGLCRRHKSRKSATQVMKVGDMICVADFHDLCPRLSARGSFSESRKVGIMEFGLKQATTQVDPIFHPSGLGKSSTGLPAWD